MRSGQDVRQLSSKEPVLPRAGHLGLDQVPDGGQIGLGLEDHCHVIADPKLVFEEERGAEALEGALRHDGLAVGQDVSLIHEVRRKEDHLALLSVLQHGPQMPEGKEKNAKVNYWRNSNGLHFQALSR